MSSRRTSQKVPKIGSVLIMAFKTILAGAFKSNAGVLSSRQLVPFLDLPGKGIRRRRSTTDNEALLRCHSDDDAPKKPANTGPSGTPPCIVRRRSNDSRAEGPRLLDATSRKLCGKTVGVIGIFGGIRLRPADCST